MHHTHKRTESQANKLNDVIVVGAGLSGLSAAKVCHDKGLNVLVLEARDRVGGRTLSDDSGCDLGGSWFVPEHRNLFNLIAELGLKCQADVPAAIGGMPLFYSNQAKIGMKYDDTTTTPFIGRYNLLAKLDLIACKRRIDELCCQIDLIEPWNSKNAKKLDSISFRQFIEQTCYTQQVREYFLYFLAPINLTNEAEDCSLLFALYFIRSWGGVERCIGLGQGVTLSRVVGGSQLLSTRMCQQIGEERVLLNKPVHTIDQQTNSELVTVITKDGARYEASRVIVALPPNLQTAITFKPNIPLKSQLNHRYPPGLCTKVILYYDRAYWYDNGFNGHINVMNDKHADDRKVCGRGRKDLRRSEVRRSVCRTSSTSGTNVITTTPGSGANNESTCNMKTDDMYASTNSLLLPGINGDRTNNCNQMLKDTKETQQQQQQLQPQQAIPIPYDETYCAPSFVTPDYSRGQPSLIGLVCGSAWIRYHQIEKQEDRINTLAKCYARLMHPKLAEPLSYKELNWVSEEYSRGAYTSVMTPGTMTKYGSSMRAPVGRITFAGTELSLYWPGTMEGAIRSGRKAAMNILRDLQRVDIDENSIVDDEEVQVQLQDTFMERHANKLLNLSKLALNTPVLIVCAAAIGFSMHKIAFRCSMSI